MGQGSSSNLGSGPVPKIQRPSTPGLSRSLVHSPPLRCYASGYAAPLPPDEEQLHYKVGNVVLHLLCCDRLNRDRLNRLHLYVLPQLPFIKAAQHEPLLIPVRVMNLAPSRTAAVPATVAAATPTPTPPAAAQMATVTATATAIAACCGRRSRPCWICRRQTCCLPYKLWTTSMRPRC